jgi:hypothetical protein
MKKAEHTYLLAHRMNQSNQSRILRYPTVAIDEKNGMYSSTSAIASIALTLIFLLRESNDQ